MNSKAFAIPILTTIYIVSYKLDAIRIGIANALEFIAILWQLLSCIFNLFSYYLIPNFLHSFFDFDLYSCFKIADFKIISSLSSFFMPT